MKYAVRKVETIATTAEIPGEIIDPKPPWKESKIQCL
jgi:hypothetical protein